MLIVPNENLMSSECLRNLSIFLASNDFVIIEEKDMRLRRRVRSRVNIKSQTQIKLSTWINFITQKKSFRLFRGLSVKLHLFYVAKKSCGHVILEVLNFDWWDFFFRKQLRGKFFILKFYSSFFCWVSTWD